MSVVFSTDCIVKKTRQAVIVSSLLNEPLFSLYALMAFILRKDLGATAFQIATLATLKPLVSLFSLYSSVEAGGARALRANILLTGVLARAPFFLLPFCTTSWACIFIAATHILFLRASLPAWMEILKINVPTPARQIIFSQGAALGYAISVVAAIGLAEILDHMSYVWRSLFVGSAALSLLAVLCQGGIRIRGEEREIARSKKQEQRFLQWVLAPWKSAWQLMCTRKDFAQFQWGFMACGSGVMLLQPALPLFFVDQLCLSYTDLAIALSVCKGLGFVFSSFLWTKAMKRYSLMRCSSIVFIGVGCFPAALLLTSSSTLWVYVAYLLYGIAQAGSHLIWNLSGPLFANNESSTTYTAVNIVMVGLRGMAAPLLGGALCMAVGPKIVLEMATALCVLGSFLVCWRVEKPTKELFLR